MEVIITITYDSSILKILNDVFEDTNDDRLWKYIPKVLPFTLTYLHQVCNQIG